MNPAIAGNPRRWDTTVDGFMWLPRMADKARMRESGSLGAYLCGHSPIDTQVLHILGLSTDEFVTIATVCKDDESLLARLREHGFDETKLHAWCDVFPKRWGRMFVPLWSLDEGYVVPNLWQKALIAVVRMIERPLFGAFRKVHPAP